MQAGRRAGLRSAAMRLFGASDRRFPLLFDGGRETSRAATHVDSCDGILSDAGSTPAASTNLRACVWRRLPSVARADCPSGTFCETSTLFLHVALGRALGE